VGIDPIVFFVTIHVTFVCLLIAIWLAVRFFHNRSFISLITEAKRVNLGRVAFGFAVWSALDAISIFGGWLISPENYQFTMHLPEFVCFVPIVLLLVPVQTFAEEVFFRGYLLQALGCLTKRGWLAATLSGVLFVLPHMGPGVRDPLIMAAIYWSAGFFTAAVTIRTNSIEIAFGAHLANNVFALLVANYAEAPVKASSILTCTQMNKPYQLATTICSGLILYLLSVRFIARKD